MNKKYWIIALLAILAVASIIYFSTNKQTIDYDIKVPVVIDDLIITVKTTGELQAENSEQISAPNLRQIGVWRIKITDLVPEGTLVDSGEYVAQLDKNEIDQKLEEVKEQLQKAESQYEQTQLDTALDLRSLRDQLINLNYAVEEAEIEMEESIYESPATKRQANISLDKAKRAYSQALESYDLKVAKNQASMTQVHISLVQQQRRLKDLQEVMNQLTILAPKSGMVIYQKEWGGQKRKVGSEVGGWDPVVATLPDMSSMMSKTYINEIDISKVSKGQNVSIEIDAFPGQQYAGIVTEVANVGEDLPNSDAKVFEVLIKILASDSILRPNMTTSNIITVDELKSVLQIPLEAIRNNDSLVYVVKESGFSKVRQIVEPGLSNENRIQILQGLSEEDIVYLSKLSNENELKFEGMDIYEELKTKRLKKLEEEAAKRKLEEEMIEQSKNNKNGFQPGNFDINTVRKQGGNKRRN